MRLSRILDITSYWQRVLNFAFFLTQGLCPIGSKSCRAVLGLSEKLETRTTSAKRSLVFSWDGSQRGGTDGDREAGLGSCQTVWKRSHKSREQSLRHFRGTSSSSPGGDVSFVLRTCTSSNTLLHVIPNVSQNRHIDFQTFREFIIQTAEKTTIFFACINAWGYFSPWIVFTN